MHKRKEIKQKFVSIITAAGIFPAGNIYPNRWIPAEDDDFPCSGVYALQEQIEPNDTEVDRRRLDVLVEIFCSGATADDELDELTHDVEHALVQDETLQGTVSTMRIKNVDIGRDEGSSSSVVAARLTYEVEYYTPHYADNPTDSFATVELDGAFRDTIEPEQEG